MTEPTKWTIRGIPEDIIRETKAQAARQDKTLGQYVSEALNKANLA